MLLRKKLKEKKGYFSKEYLDFLLAEQKAREPQSFYEKFCKIGEKLKIKPPKGLEEKLKTDIAFSSVIASPEGVFSSSILALILSFLVFTLFSLVIQDFITLIFLSILPFVIFWYILTYPSFLSQVIRIQAGDESIKIILYMVIYLKLNPTFEGAINFVTTHISGPITNDMKKAIWDLQVGKYTTVEEALSQYMPKWAIWNEDFVRSLNLLYGTLREATEERREATLRKALSYILESTHERMKLYVEEISSPLMLIHLFGIMLPALGIVMFPMVAIFLHQQVNVFQLILGYTVLLPLLNLFFIYRILKKRPGAFISPDISRHPELPREEFFVLKFGKTNLYIPIIFFSLLIGLLIMLYGILHFVDLYTSLSVAIETAKETILKKEAEMSLENLLSTFSITAGFAAMVISYFYFRSFQRIKIRNQIKNIEDEFRTGLVTLGNFLSEGMPIEVAINKSLEEYQKLGMQKRAIHSFLTKLLINIRNFGMTFRKALFDEKTGILRYYPSRLIEDIMKVLSDASEKSTILLGVIARTIANYLDNVHSIELKIRELLENTRSAIRIQASFVVPLICGIIGSLTIFIINVLRILADKLAEIEKSLGLGVLTGGENFMNILIGNFRELIPLTVLQAAIGIYTVETVALLAMLLSGIENGFDKTARDYTIGKTLITAILIYGMVSFFGLLLFYSLGVSIELS